MLAGLSVAALAILTPLAHGEDAKAPPRGMWGTEIAANFKRWSPPSEKIKNVIWDLEKLFGIPFHVLFELRAVGGSEEMGAIAVLEGNRRLIYYGKGFDTHFNDPRGNYDAYIVLLHEVGHHLLKHTFEKNELASMELEADRFAGCIVGMLGGTRKDVTDIYDKRAPEKAVGIHPGRAKRVAQVVEGWKVGFDRISPDKARCMKMPRLN
jgi:hypothetical protein